MPTFKALDYLVAGLAYHYSGQTAEYPFPKNLDEVERDFHAQFTTHVPAESLSKAISELSRLNILTFDNDKYAGTTLSIKREVVDDRFSTLSLLGYKLFRKVGQLKYPWLQRVFDNPEFIEDLQGKASSSDIDEEIDRFEVIPAADRTVTILHNSNEGQILSAGIEAIGIDLNSNNEVAVEAGDDRERLTAEASASLKLLSGEKIRLSTLRDLVWRFLKEVAGKFKGKAEEWGVEKMIEIIQSFLDHGA